MLKSRNIETADVLKSAKKAVCRVLAFEKMSNTLVVNKFWQPYSLVIDLMFGGLGIALTNRYFGELSVLLGWVTDLFDDDFGGF